MKRIPLLLLLVFTFSGICQTPKNWSLTAKCGDGFIVAHRPSVVHVLQKHTRDFELDYTFKTKSRKGWEELYNFPELGLAYQYFNLGNPSELGSAHGIFGLVNFKLAKHRANFIHAHLGLGLGYVTKTFNTTDNYRNLLVGSHMNAAITTGIDYYFRCSEKVDFTTGINLTHFSDGGSKVPNMGINLANINAGVVYHLRPTPQIIKDTFDFERKKSFEVLIAGGIKQIYPPNSPRYGVGILTTDYIKPAKKKSLLTAGIDLYVDGSHKNYLAEDSLFVHGIESVLRGGIHFGYGLSVGRCSGILQIGYYLYNPYDIDGSIYNTLSFRYHINEYLFACFNLKAHFGRADYFQYGLGYHF
jgi:hypothetical protein